MVGVNNKRRLVPHTSHWYRRHPGRIGFEQQTLKWANLQSLTGRTCPRVREVAGEGDTQTHAHGLLDVRRRSSEAVHHPAQSGKMRDGTQGFCHSKARVHDDGEPQVNSQLQLLLEETYLHDMVGRALLEIQSNLPDGDRFLPVPANQGSQLCQVV